MVLAEAMNYVVSDRAERIFGYIAEKFLAFLFIAALWGIVWAFIDNFKKTYVKVLFFIWFVLVSVYGAIKEIVNSVRKRTERLPAGVISATVLMELCAIMLVMPEDNIGYIQPTICAGMIVLIAYFAWGKALKKQ